LTGAYRNAPYRLNQQKVIRVKCMRWRPWRGQFIKPGVLTPGKSIRKNKCPEGARKSPCWFNHVD